MQYLERRYFNGIVRNLPFEMSLSFHGNGSSIQHSFYDMDVDEPPKKRFKGLIDDDIITISDDDEEDFNISEDNSSILIVSKHNNALKQEPVTNGMSNELNDNSRTLNPTSTSAVNLESDDDLPEIFLGPNPGNKSESNSEHGDSIKRVPEQESVTNSISNELNEISRTLNLTSTSAVNLESDDDLPEIFLGPNPGNDSQSDGEHGDSIKHVPEQEPVTNGISNECNPNTRTLNQPSTSAVTSTSAVNLESDEDLPEIIFQTNLSTKREIEGVHNDICVSKQNCQSSIMELNIDNDDDLPDISLMTFSSIKRESESEHKNIFVSKQDCQSSIVELDNDNDLPDISSMAVTSVKSGTDSDRSDVSVQQEPIRNGNTIGPRDACICVSGRETTLSADATGPASDKQCASQALLQYLSNYQHLAVKVPACCKKLGICKEIHNKEGPAHPSSPHFTSLIKTMLSSDDENLQHMALNHVCQKGVQEHQYMSLDLMHLILGYMIGYKYENEIYVEQKSVPELRALALASSILHNQLRKHPPCKPSMLRYYKKVVECWWKLLIRKIEDALKLLSNQEMDHEAPRAPEDALFQLVEESGIDHFTDALAYTARLKREREEEQFLSLRGKERLSRLIFPLQFFVNLMEKDVLVWLAKFWNPKAPAFRSSIRPIITDLLWSSNDPDEGFPNQKCRDLLNLYQVMWFEPDYRRLFVRMIAVIAEVMRRKRPGKYPNIPENCLDFARYVHFCLKNFCRECPESLCHHVCGALTELYPHWLRFNVGALLLQVQSPANLCRVKECLTGESNLSSTKSMVYSITLAAAVEMLQLPSISHCHSNSKDCEPPQGASFDVDVVTQGALTYQRICAMENLDCVTHFPKWV